MSNKVKKWLFIATSFIIMGCIIFAGTMMKLNWDFRKLSTVKYEENNHTIDKEFKNINIDTNTADIKIQPSDDDICRVVFYEEKKVKHTVKVVNDTLKISVTDQRKWYEHIGISLDNTKITVYLPKNEYGSVVIKENTGDIKIAKNFVFENISIKASTANTECYASVTDLLKINLTTGDIKAENITVGKIELSVSTGDISLNSINCENEVNVKVSTGRTKLANVLCNSIISSGSTGDISLVDVIANKEITINRTTGDIQLDRCDAQDLFIETDTGHVKGSLLSDKVFITQSDTGRISVPKTVTGGKCEITTDTGDIKIIVIALIK